MRWEAARPWCTNAVLLAIGVGMVMLSRQLVREHGHFQIGFSGVSGWSAVLYVLACAVILTQPVNRWTLPLIFVVAIVCRGIALVPPPFLSSDIYRYAWDGVVQHAGISPYRYVPGDRALRFLRGPNRDLFEHINRRDYAHTIYPPLAQMIFFLVTWVAPTVRGMKVTMVLLEAVTVGALLGILRGMGRRPEQILLYAWCPLLVWEVAEAGHLDAAGMAFVALAMLARMRRQPVLSGLWLGIAVMIKFYPLVLFPALWWRGDGKGSGWKMPMAMVAVIALGYGCYAGVGKLVFGFAAGYVQEEGLESGMRYFLLELARRLPKLHGVPVAGFVLFSAAVFGGLMLWAWRTCSDASDPPTAFIGPAAGLAFALMLLFSPHYPWYVIWLIPFFALLPNPPMLAYLMGLFYGLTTALAVPGPRMFLLNEYVYGGTAIGFCVWWLARRWPLHRPLMVTEGEASA